MRRGFTLLEVLISVAIFLLIAGGIFEAVSISMKASRDISMARLESERIDSFQRFGRLLFSDLPGDSRVELRVRQGRGGRDIVELLLSPVPALADFSSDSRPSGGLALSALPDRAGAYTISAANFDDEASPVERDEALEAAVWIPLLPGVKSIRWKFAAPDSPWLEETWPAGRGRPTLAELELGLADGENSRFQFAIPRMAAAQVSGAPPVQP